MPDPTNDDARRSAPMTSSSSCSIACRSCSSALAGDRPTSPRASPRSSRRHDQALIRDLLAYLARTPRPTTSTRPT